MKRIYLSPSTQENNQGVGNYKTEEMRCGEICNIVESVLKNYDVAIKRNKPSMSLSAVVKDSNSFKPDYHVAIHTNAFNKKARGCEAFCYTKTSLGSKGFKMATAIFKKVADITPSEDRGVKEGKDFYGAGKDMYEMANTSAPAALIEIIFHDNLEDVEWFLSHKSEIGNAIAEAIIEVMELQKKSVKRAVKIEKDYSWVKIKLTIEER